MYNAKTKALCTSLFRLCQMALLVVFLLSCKQAPEPLRGDPVRGEDLYKQTHIGSANAAGCITCHALEPDLVIVGPSHAGLATRAGQTVEGQSDYDYLKESIKNPAAYLVEGFMVGSMYGGYGTDLTEQEIEDLIAFMLTLE